MYMHMYNVKCHIHVYIQCTIAPAQTHTIKGTMYPSTGIKNSAIVGSIFLRSFCV